jgi:uncharacterized protein YigE (DUF2233 family)
MRSLIACLLCIVCCDANISECHSELLYPGVYHRTINAGAENTIEVVVVEPHTTKIAIVSSISSQNASLYNFDVGSDLSITDYYHYTHPIAMVTGGYLLSFSPPVPLGAIVIKGRTLSRPIHTWVGEGWFCTDGNEWSIKGDNMRETRSSDCIQSGPLLISRGTLRYQLKETFSEGEGRVFSYSERQVFVCTTDDGSLVLGVSTSPMRLDVLSDNIKDKLNCDNAIGLTGGDTAAMYYGRRLLGHDTLPLTSVIAVLKN